jgi:hypothetical protein
VGCQGFELRRTHPADAPVKSWLVQG